MTAAHEFESSNSDMNDETMADTRPDAEKDTSTPHIDSIEGESGSVNPAVDSSPAASNSNFFPPPADSDRRPRRDINTQQNIGYNNGIVASVVETVRKSLDHHDLPDHYVQACASSFAPPEGINEAHTILNNNHIVVIVSGQDTGRHHAAVYLLNSQQNITLREVRRETDDRLDVDALDIQKNSGWLLDLRNESYIEHSFGRSLVGRIGRLRSSGSYLVVIVPPDLWNRSGAGAEHLVSNLKPANAQEVVRAHLQALDPPIGAEPYLTDTRIAQRLSSASPKEAVRWAQAIETVETRSFEPQNDQEDIPRSTEDVRTKRVEAAIKVRGNWRKELLEWHKHNQESRTRNFLLAAAVLEGCTAGEIFEAARSIAKALGEDSHDVKGQRGPGILELVERIDAHIPDDERVEFQRPDFANAVLDYFWVDRQHLQTHFVSWMCRLPLTLEDERTTEAVTDRIAQYVLRWTVRHRRLKLLRDVAEVWAPRKHLRDVLATLMTAAALDPEVGKTVREQLLEWVKDNDTSVSIKTVIAQVCGRELVRIHPRAALFRLATLSQSPDETVGQAVTDAVRELWKFPKLRDQIVDRVSSWCADDDSGRKSAGVGTFLALAGLRDDESGEPELALHAKVTSKHPQDLLIRGWRAVFSARPSYGAAGETLAVWLNAALHSSDVRKLLKDALANAVHGTDNSDTDYRRFTLLNDMLYRWEPPLSEEGDRHRVELREEILNHILRSTPELSLLSGPPTSDDNRASTSE